MFLGPTLCTLYCPLLEVTVDHHHVTSNLGMRSENDTTLECAKASAFFSSEYMPPTIVRDLGNRPELHGNKPGHGKMRDTPRDRLP